MKMLTLEDMLPKLWVALKAPLGSISSGSYCVQLKK